MGFADFVLLFLFLLLLLLLLLNIGGRLVGGGGIGFFLCSDIVIGLSSP